MKPVAVRRKFLASTVTMSLFVGANLLPSAAAESPSLSLFTAKNEMKVRRHGHRPAFFDPGVFVTASGGPLELWVSRSDYDRPREVTQVVHTTTGTETRPLPPDVLDEYAGLRDFFNVEVRTSKGKIVSSTTVPFCPSGWEKQRLNDAGPIVSEYPSFCYLNPFSKSVVWGLEEGWGTSALGFEGVVVDGPDGRYDVTVSIAPQYLVMFEIPSEAATATIAVTVKTDKKKCRRHCNGKPTGGSGPLARPDAGAGEPVPTLDNPDPSVLPDLVALPAWSIFVDRRRTGDFMSFAANVWTGGASPLVVEGFRQQNSDVMDAYQYFYKDGAPVGRMPAGTFEYDNRRRHTHWHFQQFVGYRLLNADGSEAVRSKKESFCLAPTDPIDLSLPGAEWAPASDFSTACGAPTSIWIREILPLGWGDTYYQGVPGQSFEITDVPNGTYFIEVQANPLGSLKEQDLSNNTQLREVILKGKPGNRKVVVPPWHGIDTEGPSFDEMLLSRDG